MSVFRVRGSAARKVLFWAHLCCGVSAGLIILIMSFTGVLLAYESQISAHAAQRNRVVVPAAQAPLSAEQLARAVRSTHPDAGRFSLVFNADPAMPVTATKGREAGPGSGFPLLLNPYTGAVLPDAAAGTRQFFRTVENWHRWLGGSPRGVIASAADLANLLFLLMTLSGLYLWLPDTFRWRTLRGLLLLRARYVNARVRDFSWHHVLGIWMLIPLFLISFSGVVMSYPWANNLLYASFGETPPTRPGPPGEMGAARGEAGARGGTRGAPAPAAGEHAPGAGEHRGHRGDSAPLDESRHAAGAPDGLPARRASLDELLAAAKANAGPWRTLTLPVTAPSGRVEVVAEMPSTSPRAPRRTLVLNAQDASVTALGAPQRGGFAGAGGAPSPAGMLRGWLRFTHTGEQFGVIGQTVAAIASLVACVLVYTGLALAFRRLLLPLWRREPHPAQSMSST